MSIGGAEVTRRDFATRDSDVAWAWQTEVYTDHERELLRGRDTYAFTTSLVRHGGLTVSRSGHAGCDLRLDVPQTDFVGVQHVVTGRVTVGNGTDARTAGDGGTVLLEDSGYTAHHTDSYSENLTIDLTALHDSAGDAVEGVGAVRFAGRAPLSPALERQWLSVVAYTESTLRSGLILHPLVLEASTRLVATSLLATFGLAGPLPRLPRGGVEPAAVARARAFMEAHAGEPLTVAQIAESADIGIRALQLAFQRQLGMTPMTHLRDIRLAHAHRELQAADPREGATVGQIAVRWGFPHGGRFATSYRQAYGVTPSETLWA